MSGKPMRMKLKLPLPTSELSPNARCHWRVKAKHVAAYRGLTKTMARKGKPETPLKSATVQCVFYFRDRRRRDSDNLLAMMKSCFDGLVDAGVFEDDNELTHLPVQKKKDAENPRVEIIVISGEEQSAQPDLFARESY